MGDDLFDIDVVRDFMISRNGKVTNHELVTHFKPFLSDPKHRAGNRVKFKDFVNKLATVKLDESGEKVLVLKKKYRDTGGEAAPSSGQLETREPRSGASKAKKAKHDKAGSAAASDIVTAAAGDSAAADVSVDVSMSQGKKAGGISDMISALYEAAAADVDSTEVPSVPKEEIPSRNLGTEQSPVKDTSEAVDPGQVQVEAEEVGPDASEVSQMESPQPDTLTSLSPAAGSEELKPGGTETGDSINTGEDTVVVLTAEDQLAAQETPVTTETAMVVEGSSPASVVAEKEEQEETSSPMNVRERAMHLNKITSESDLSIVLPKADTKPVDQRKDDDDSHYTATGEMISLEADEKEWMVLCSTADYHPMNKMLLKNKNLAKLRDFTSGYTALHWAAKHGKPEVVKLLCGTGLVNVNARSHGGYTPLHLAAIHGHEDVLDLLVSTYKANPNLRDYSGKKPKQYLSHSASSRAQQILQSLQQGTTMSTSAYGQFRRSGSYSEKIHRSGYFGISMSPAMRSSWVATREGSAEREKPTRSPSWSPSVSPRIHRKGSLPRDTDMAKMPPPQNAPLKRKKEKKSKHNKENEQGSSRESSSSRHSDSDLSAFPTYDGTQV